MHFDLNYFMVPMLFSVVFVFVVVVEIMWKTNKNRRKRRKESNAK